MQREKKIRAAIAGVMMLLEEEQSMRARVEPVPVNVPVPWAQHGRRTIMQNRELLQRRVIKR